MLAKWIDLERIELIRDILLVVGLAFTSATALRVGINSIGIGELSLAIWSLISIVAAISRKNFSFNRQAGVIVLFWLVSFCVLLAGYLNAKQLGLESPSAMHDFLAYCFVFFLLAVYAYNPPKKVESILYWTIALNLVVVYGVLLFALFAERELSARYWLDWSPEKRFMGVSLNPNQLALQLVPVEFLLLGVVRFVETKWEKGFVVFLMLFALQIEYFVRSDAVYVATAFAMATLFLFMVVPRLIVLSQDKRVYAYALAFLLLCGVVAIFVNNANYLFDLGVKFFDSEGGQGSLRISLWRNALYAATHSPWVGLGPGAHSGDTAPFLNWEAHNIFLDWLSAVGVIGELFFVALIAMISKDIFNRTSSVWAASFVALIVFSFFHFTFRQPIFWFYIVLIWQLAMMSMQGTSASKLN